MSFAAETNYFIINPLSPHDAIKHHFTSLKTLQLGFWEWKHETGLEYMAIFLIFFTHFKSSSSTTSRELRHSRLVVDEDDNGKCRLERVKW